jgi:hypothetical protein
MLQSTQQPFDAENIELAVLGAFADRIARLANKAQGETESANACIAQLEIHENWVHLVASIRRLYDALDVAAQITDVALIKQRLDTAVGDIQQELASVGLRSYGQIYAQFAGIITEIARELDTLANLARVRSESGKLRRDRSAVPNAPQTQLEAFTDEGGEVPQALLRLLQEVRMSLRSSFARSGLDSEGYLAALIELQEQGLLHLREKRPAE